LLSTDNSRDQLLKTALQDAIMADYKFIGLSDAEHFIRDLITALSESADEAIDRFPKERKTNIKHLVYRLAFSYEKHFNKKPKKSRDGNFGKFCRRLGVILDITIGEDLLKDVIDYLNEKTTG
jgi:hypothetical protein